MDGIAIADAHALTPTAQQILAYLTRHPNAQDTVEGIAAWWLLEENIRSSITETQMALDQLVAANLVVEQTSPDGKCFYRVATGQSETRPGKGAPGS
jgi:uncharacterized lipoprotein YddW (UPF0748 family)